MAFRCPDCGMEMGFDPATAAGARVLKYHRENICGARAWKEWREERRRQRSRRQSGATDRAHGRSR